MNQVSSSINEHILASYAALLRCPPIERVVYIFWLIGPFVLLIERTPGDVWLTVIGLSFLIRSFYSKQFHWIGNLWVRLGALFLFVCLCSAAVSAIPTYSFVETIIWVRFPLFVCACCFWLNKEPQLIRAMMVSVLLGALIMSGILFAEFFIEGQKQGRLSWPYGDLVPGSYLAKFSLPAILFLLAATAGAFANLKIAASFSYAVILVACFLTGERVNLLIIVCASGMAAVFYRLLRGSIYSPTNIGIIAFVVALGVDFIDGHSRIVWLAVELFNWRSSPHLQVIMGGWEAFKTSPLLGIGPANYRHLAPSILENSELFRPDNHPHNYYIQILCEVGVLGLISGVLFLGSIIIETFKLGRKSQPGSVSSLLWIVPFALFWPVATHADFFGQWINVFAWSAIGVAIGYAYSAAAYVEKEVC